MNQAELISRPPSQPQSATQSPERVGKGAPTIRTRACQAELYPLLAILLTWGIETGHRQFVSKLLEAGANPRSTDNEGRPMLALAARLGRRHMAHLLLEHGARLDQRGLDRRLPLAEAISAGKPATARWLLYEGGCPSTRQQFKREMLAASGARRWEEALALLCGNAFDSPATRAALYLEILPDWPSRYLPLLLEAVCLPSLCDDVTASLLSQCTTKRLLPIKRRIFDWMLTRVSLKTLLLEAIWKGMLDERTRVLFDGSGHSLDQALERLLAMKAQRTLNAKARARVESLLRSDRCSDASSSSSDDTTDDDWGASTVANESLWKLEVLDLADSPLGLGSKPKEAKPESGIPRAEKIAKADGTAGGRKNAKSPLFGCLPTAGNEKAGTFLQDESLLTPRQYWTEWLSKQRFKLPDNEFGRKVKALISDHSAASPGAVDENMLSTLLDEAIRRGEYDAAKCMLAIRSPEHLLNQNCVRIACVDEALPFLDWAVDMQQGLLQACKAASSPLAPEDTLDALVMCAAFCNAPRVIRHFGKKIDLATVHVEGDYLPHYLALLGRPRLLRLLIKLGVPLDERRPTTPLGYAVTVRNWTSAKILWPHSDLQSKLAVVSFLASLDDHKSVRKVFAFGLDCSLGELASLLFSARSASMISILMANGADPLHAEGRSHSPLEFFIREQNYQCVHACITSLKSTAAKSARALRALGLAIEAGLGRTIELLLAAGVRPGPVQLRMANAHESGLVWDMFHYPELFASPEDREPRIPARTANTITSDGPGAGMSRLFLTWRPSSQGETPPADIIKHYLAALDKDGGPSEAARKALARLYRRQAVVLSQRPLEQSTTATRSTTSG